MDAQGSRSDKVMKIFQQFDTNFDGGLNRDEMASLVAAVNPRVKFTHEQIDTILDEVFRTYSEFIDDEKGLTRDGLMRTYHDGAGDVDRDFDALGLVLNPGNSAEIHPEADEGTEDPQKTQRIAAWAASPSYGIAFDETWKIVDELEKLVSALKIKQTKDGKHEGESLDSFSDGGWSRELGASSDGLEQPRVNWEFSGSNYASFTKELGVLRSRVDHSMSAEKSLDGHMAIGKVLFEHQLFNEALVSFRRASEFHPADIRPHFSAGNCLYFIGRHSEAKSEFLLALESGKAGGDQWAYLLPQICVNIGTALEAEGLVLSACEYYRKAVALCPSHFRALKHLGSALFGVGEHLESVKVLKEAILLKPDYVDAHCDMASALHAIGEDEQAIEVFQKALDLKPSHVESLYNLGGLYMDLGRFQRASEMYTRVLLIWPGHWRAQINRAISLLGVGEMEEAKKYLKESLKLTNRVELHDTILHLKHLQKKKGKNGHPNFITTDISQFKTIGDKTTSRSDLFFALSIREFQMTTKLNLCSVELLKDEMARYDASADSFVGGSGKSVRKSNLEEIIRRLLHFLKPDIFQGSVKAINEKILTRLDPTGSGTVDLGMLFAVVAPVCRGNADKRKHMAFDALLWCSSNEGDQKLRKSDVLNYLKLLKTVYSTREFTQTQEPHDGSDFSLVSLEEFLRLFSDQDLGFGIMSTLLRLESNDRNSHRNAVCSTCCYPINGSRFKEISSHFTLCSKCYSEGKVPSNHCQDEYKFKEIECQSAMSKDKLSCLSIQCR